MNEPAESAVAEKNKKGTESGFNAVFRKAIPRLLDFFVLILSLGLIVFISWDILQGDNFLANQTYMRYQFIVCLVFIADFAYRVCVSENPLKGFFINLPFLLISLPYLNIVQWMSWNPSHEALLFLRLIPMIRGFAALTMVMGYITRNLTTTVCASYLIVSVTIIYICALIFYDIEGPVNPGVKNFWYALWWTGMNATTVGTDINPQTPIGMGIAFFVSLLGIIMFPLFTVYFGSLIRKYSRK